MLSQINFPRFVSLKDEILLKIPGDIFCKANIPLPD